MAPPSFPNGISLYSIGYAALKYPLLPPPTPIPLTNQIGALQHEPSASQNHQISQIASQYLPELLEYQTSPNELLSDPKSPQYYFSTVLMLLNFLNTNPDVCRRVIEHKDGALIHGIVEKMLVPTFVDDMKKAERPVNMFMPASFEDEFGSLLQFLSTLLLHVNKMTDMHPRIKELVPKLRTWKLAYKRSGVRTISNASDRLVQQIQGTMPRMMMQPVKAMQNKMLVCGVRTCHIGGQDDTVVCSVCRIQRYCGPEHQKMDWKYHKKLCCKGLVEEAASS